MEKVYVAGPYTHGNTANNVAEAIRISTKLIDLGYAPFCPHLNHFLHMHKPQPYEKWLEIDIEFLKTCNYLLRLPGISSGADREVEVAEYVGIPVLYYNDNFSLDELLHRKNRLIR
jgi:hypothetical protein